MPGPALLVSRDGLILQNIGGFTIQLVGVPIDTIDLQAVGIRTLLLEKTSDRLC